MPVIIAKKARQSRGYLRCDHPGCDAQSREYTGASPAAPHLSICEAAAEAEGWAYSLGFWSMLRGHEACCPAHISEHDLSAGWVVPRGDA